MYTFKINKLNTPVNNMLGTVDLIINEEITVIGFKVMETKQRSTYVEPPTIKAGDGSMMATILVSEALKATLYPAMLEAFAAAGPMESKSPLWGT